MNIKLSPIEVTRLVRSGTMKFPSVNNGIADELRKAYRQGYMAGVRAQKKKGKP